MQNQTENVSTNNTTKPISDYLIKEKEKIIKDAKVAALADGIYKSVAFNDRVRWRGTELKIDIYVIFPNESVDTVDFWIKKARKLLHESIEVGDKIVDRANLPKRGLMTYEVAQSRYEEAHFNFINNNPGFSDETYEDAIRMGASIAVH